MMKLKYAFAAVAAIAATFVIAQDKPAASPTDIQGTTPQFKMTGADGKAFSNEDLKGKVVLVDFWATWCGPCKVASPAVQALHEKYGEKGLVAIGANCFERENKDTAAGNYAKEHKYTYLMTVNNDALAKAWNVRGIPTFAILDKAGKVRKVQVGFAKGKTETVLEDAVKQLLAE
ncbi:MAG: TlpA family protein disulfide reductase [Fimbriimonadales bacterium]